MWITGAAVSARATGPAVLSAASLGQVPNDARLRNSRRRAHRASRVGLGTHLAEGTMVMHEGFVNFNAGTLGAAMIEGRLSQGVVVGRSGSRGLEKVTPPWPSPRLSGAGLGQDRWSQSPECPA